MFNIDEIDYRKKLEMCTGINWSEYFFTILNKKVFVISDLYKEIESGA